MPSTRSGRRRQGPARAPRGAQASTGPSRGPSAGHATHAGRSGATGQRDAAARAGSGAASPVTGAPSAWVTFTAFGLSLAGLGMSIYLTVEHFLNGSSLACPDTGVINCAKVTSSPQSAVFGIPVAVLGLAFFIFMTAINSPPAWRAPWPAVRPVRVISVIAGIGFVIYLIYAELFVIGNICLECTSVHVITFALFVLIVFTATGSSRAAPNRR